jgi:RNA polymerase sigma-70 factor (ECF subfamily)
MGFMLKDRSKASFAMDAYADGDGTAFEVVYDELAPRLFSYVLRMTRVRTVSEDIVQQSFLNMHRARGRFVRGTPVEPWAFAIARRLTIDWARLERRVTSGLVDTLPIDALGPEMDAQQTEFVEGVRAELESIPAKLREAFLLVRVEGFSTAEAAEVLGTTATAVKLRAHRVGALLRNRLSHPRDPGHLE